MSGTRSTGHNETRPYIKGEDVEAYLVEMTAELVNQRATTPTFIPPKLTAVEIAALVDPAAGMVVYDTTNNLLKFYNGSTWGTV